MAGDDVVGDGYGDGDSSQPCATSPPTVAPPRTRPFDPPTDGPPTRHQTAARCASTPAGARSGGRYPPAPSLMGAVSSPADAMPSNGYEHEELDEQEDGETNRNQEDGETNRYQEDGETNRYQENGETNRYRHDGYQEGDDGESRNRGCSHPHDYGHGMNQPVAAPYYGSSLRAPPQHVAHPAPYVRAPCPPAASSGPRDVGNPDGSYYAPGTMAAEHFGGRAR